MDENEEYNLSFNYIIVYINIKLLYKLYDFKLI